MTSKIIKLTRKEYDLIAKTRGIKEPQNMSNDELLHALSICDSKRKVKNNRRKLKKMNLKKLLKYKIFQNMSENELLKTEKLQNKSIDELCEIARLIGFDNKRFKSTKEDLILSLLKSESNPAERNYMKNFNNSISDDTYDDKIKSKINYIRMILSRLGNIVTKKYRKEIKKELYEIEKKQNLSDNEKEKIYDHLLELANKFDKKEKYKRSDHDDEDYFGINELENLFGDVDNDDYYKPVLVRSSFKKRYKYYESRGDKGQ